MLKQGILERLLRHKHITPAEYIILLGEQKETKPIGDTPPYNPIIDEKTPH